MKNKTEARMKNRTEARMKNKTEAQMKDKTEERIQKALVTLHKAVMAYYKEHPEGRRDMRQEIDCYGSAIIGIRDHGDGVEGIATITVYTANGFKDIESTIHHRRIKNGSLCRRQQ